MAKPYTLGIIGHPIGHSLSPLMHSVAARKIGIDLSYSAFDVEPDNVGKAVEAMRVLSIDGLNVTVPHKVAVMKYLDEVDDDAKMIGAVNTIARKGDTLIGYNTDVYGFAKSLTENGQTWIAGKKAIVYGAGGAARAVVAALVKNHADEIIVVNRTLGRAVELVESYEDANVIFSARDFDDNKLFESVDVADIIINATSVGMAAADVEKRLPGTDYIREGQLVVDIIYSTPETPLLKRAKAAGASTLSGLWMLIHQGEKAFHLWTGLTFPVHDVWEALTVELEKRHK